MIKRRFIAKDARRAMAMIQNTLGPHAIIFSNRRVPEGVEIIAGLEEELIAAEPMEHLSPTPAEIFRTASPAISSTPTFNSASNSTTHSNAATSAIADSLSSSFPFHPSAQQEPSLSQSPITHTSVSKNNHHEIERMKQEIELLRHLLEGQVVQSLSKKRREGPAKKTILTQQLLQLALDTDLVDELIESIFSKSPNIPNTPNFEEMTMFEAWELLQQKLEHLILTPSKEIIEEHKIIALIGATGVGKTTTLAKLATRFVLKHHPEELALITTDFNRVAAQGQLLLYGQILGVETYTVHREEELGSTLTKLHSKRLILLDTAGISQRDNLNIAKLLSVFHHHKDIIHPYLTLSCTNQASVLEEIIEAFQPMKIAGCILTKADEVANIAPAVSLTIKHRLPIAYITHGQRIPQDIRKADAHQLAQMILNNKITDESHHETLKSPLDNLAEEFE